MTGLGMYSPNAPGDIMARQQVYALLGRTPDIWSWYQHWGLPDTRRFSAAQCELTGTAIPMICWEPWNPLDPGDDTWSLRSIIEGAHDTYIRSWARAIRRCRKPMLIRFAHEMNGDWYPWGGENGRLHHAKAWERVVGHFRQMNAVNAGFVWNPNIACPGSTPLQDLAPDPATIDWIGLDGYNRDGQMTEPALLFEPTMRELNGIFPGKPVVIAETGCAESPHKAEWIAAMMDWAHFRSDVRALTWFNEHKEQDWRIDSNPAALAAFRKALAKQDRAATRFARG